MAGSRPDGVEAPPALEAPLAPGAPPALDGPPALERPPTLENEGDDRESTTVVTAPIDLETTTAEAATPALDSTAAPATRAPLRDGEGEDVTLRHHLAEHMPELAAGSPEEAEGDGVTVRRDISAFVAAMEATRRDPSVEVLPPAVPVEASTLTPAPPAAAEPALAAALAALAPLAPTAPRPATQTLLGAPTPAGAAAPTPKAASAPASDATAGGHPAAPSGTAAQPRPDEVRRARAAATPSEEPTLVTPGADGESVPEPLPSVREGSAMGQPEPPRAAAPEPQPRRPAPAAAPGAWSEASAAPTPEAPAHHGPPAPADVGIEPRSIPAPERDPEPQPPVIPGATAALAPEPDALRAPRGSGLVPFVLGALVGAVATLAVSVGVRSWNPGPLPTAASERSTAAPAVAPSARTAPSLAERARSGDAAALAELAAKDEAERTVAEAIALIEGRHAAARGRIDALGVRLRADPAALEDPELREEIWALLNDPRTATQALAIVAQIPGPLAPDVLFRVWTTTSARTDTTELAEMLLFSREVRARASPALAIALDLRRTTDCEAVRGLLPRATSEGDARSTRPLALMAVKTGCGPTKQSDCYRCLRKDPTLLDHAIRAARARAAPKFP